MTFPSSDVENNVEIGCVICPLCDREVDVPAGVGPAEALWLHEYECAGILVPASPM
jgi:hypothetical protein